MSPEQVNTLLIMIFVFGGYGLFVAALLADASPGDGILAFLLGLGMWPLGWVVFPHVMFKNFKSGKCLFHDMKEVQTNVAPNRMSFMVHYKCTKCKHTTSHKESAF